FELFHGGVDHVFTVDAANSHGRRGSGKRDVGDGKSRGGSEGGGEFRIVLLIHRKNGRNHVRIVHIAFGKEWAAGTVDQAGVQGSFVAPAVFSLEEAAGNRSGSIVFFRVVYGEREEALAGLWFLIGNS